ncbi:SMI1/KNR4 family protein [Lactiplantibacillus pentosus]|uniref:SMI1/KNR4 family protein n=1 Tax=Lactiplantibacillus pentosus TaxID=1589 RepID=UPI0021820ACE|nr:SMI1/KNR4 family protein [Lactiplantibacillus pentosus]MCT0162791.1 SMI1/KNR4 family protein [Lactiplantibacillus pentosus]
MVSSYKQAKVLIDENEDLVDDFGGASNKLVEMGEIKLGVQFPSEYKQFLLEHGALTFGAAEIYGIFTEDFENSGVPDVVWATLDERKLVKMPLHLVMIYNTGMGEVFCLNYRELNADQEPKITSYFPGFVEDNQKNEVLYNDFGDFLLDVVEGELE